MNKEITDNLTPDQIALVDSIREMVGDNLTDTLLHIGFDSGHKHGWEKGKDFVRDAALDIMNDGRVV